MHVTAQDSDVYTLFTNPGQEFVDYLNKMLNESETALPLEQDFTAESRIVTLSTCTSSETDRFVVQGLLVSE